MTLYLVRLPDLQAALIEARSESELMDRLDEVLDPGLCTWKVYRGPVWVTFTPPVAVEIAEPADRDLDTTDVEVGKIRRKDWPLVAAVGGSETAHEMTQAIMRRAFPNIARAASDPEEIDAAAVRAAVVEDVLAHDRAIKERGTAFDAERGRLYRTEAQHFRRSADGGFQPLSSRAFAAFAEGRGRLRPDRDGAVRVVCVEIPATPDADVAIASTSLRLRVNEDGRVTEWDRATAFQAELEARLPGAAAMRDGRNVVVHWELTARELSALHAAVTEKFPRVKRIDTSGIEWKKRGPR